MDEDPEATFLPRPPSVAQRAASPGLYPERNVAMDVERFFKLEGLPGDSAKDQLHQGWFALNYWNTSPYVGGGTIRRGLYHSRSNGTSSLHVEIGSVVTASSLLLVHPERQAFSKATIEEIGIERIKGVVKERVMMRVDFNDLELVEAVWAGQRADGIALYRISFVVNVKNRQGI